MTKLVIMMVFGAAASALGFWSLRTRAYENRISPIEYAILETTKSEPLPITKSDKAWGRTQAWLMIVFGTFFFLLGLFVVGATILEVE